MHQLRVGQPLQVGFNSIPEGAYYSYDRGGHSLLLAFNNPTDAEVRAVEAGSRKQFALAIEGEVIFLLAKFGSLRWIDAPFSVHLVPPANRVLLEETENGGQHEILHVRLVDARTGIVKALAMCTFDSSFTRHLHSAIREQAARPWEGRAPYDAALSRVYRGFTTNQLLKRARAKMQVRAELPGRFGCVVVAGGGVIEHHTATLPEASAPEVPETNELIDDMPSINREVDRSSQIRVAVGDFVQAGRRYPAPLPGAVAAWYAYLSEAGHCIVCIPREFFDPTLSTDELDDYLVAAPVRSVMRGYTIERGYVVVNLSYDSTFGVEYPDSDEEF